MKRIISIAAGTLLGVSAAFAADDSPYLRVVTPDATTMRLDLAVRTLVSDDPAKPVVHLVGAVHIGDPSFYTDLQAYLDVHDVVLYEGVGGAREAVAEPPDDAAIHATQRRLRFLRVIAEDARRNGRSTPASVDELLASQHGAAEKIVRAAATDAWGHPIEVRVDGDNFDAASLGADGRPGGTGENADIVLSELTDERPAPSPEAAGLQRDMAHALGLEFQLDGIDYSHPHWRNSDLSIEQIRAALAGEPIPPRRTGPPPQRHLDRPASGKNETDAEKAADALFGALSGDSFMAKAMGVLMKMVGSSKQGRAMVKIMLADTLTSADELLMSQQGALGELMKVLTVDRNQAVVTDLGNIIADEPDVRSVAIFYGAGHFPDLEKQLADRFGYRWESSMWIPAITIDLKTAGLDAAQVEGFRSLMKSAIRKQLEKAD
jgi:hypothetical protein